MPKRDNTAVAAGTAGQDRPDLTGRDPSVEFGRLFDLYSRQVHHYLARRVGSQIAHGLVSETFLVALNQRHSYDPGQGAARPWLYGIATNLQRRHARDEVRALRATARLTGQMPDEPGHDSRVAARVDAEGVARKLASALADLADGDRGVLLLISWAGLALAEALGIPAGTVRSRLHRVRKSLQIWSDAQLDGALFVLHAEVPCDDRALHRARDELMAAAGEPAVR
jgi:RNA polymerase sigma-70 factor (ECF subfamily)